MQTKEGLKLNLNNSTLFSIFDNLENSIMSEIEGKIAEIDEVLKDE